MTLVLVWERVIIYYRYCLCQLYTSFRWVTINLNHLSRIFGAEIRIIVFAASKPPSRLNMWVPCSLSSNSKASSFVIDHKESSGVGVVEILQVYQLWVIKCIRYEYYIGERFNFIIKYQYVIFMIQFKRTMMKNYPN